MRGSQSLESPRVMPHPPGGTEAAGWGVAHWRGLKQLPWAARVGLPSEAGSYPQEREAEAIHGLCAPGWEGGVVHPRV